MLLYEFVNDSELSRYIFFPECNGVLLSNTTHGWNCCSRMNPDFGSVNTCCDSSNPSVKKKQFAYSLCNFFSKICLLTFFFEGNAFSVSNDDTKQHDLNCPFCWNGTAVRFEFECMWAWTFESTAIDLRIYILFMLLYSTMINDSRVW